MRTPCSEGELLNCQLEMVSSVATEVSLSRTIDLLLSDIINLYLRAEKLHWYVMLNRSEPDSDDTSKRMCKDLLSSIADLTRLEHEVIDEMLPQRNQLIEAVERRMADD